MFIRLLFSLTAIAGAAFAQSGNPAITTGQYNNGRTSSNTNETILNTSNVTSSQFGKLFSWAVDDQVFAQPLYVPGVTIGGKTTNVVYVATMNNSVYAFDAENPGAGWLWHVNLGTNVTRSNVPTNAACPTTNTTSELGILSTPVIDPSSHTMYVVAATPVSGGYAHYLHALDITSGADKQAAVLIAPSVPGAGYDSHSGVVSLSPTTTVSQRTALLLANGTVYAGFGSCGHDADPWHGWVVGYSANNLQTQTAVFNSTPNSGQGGIWQSGRGLATDSSGDIYLTTGNATGATVTTGTASGDAAKGDYPMRFVQLTSAGQFLASYPPPKYATLNQYDLDFSSSGPLQIPGTNLLIAGGKDGVVYLFNPSNLATPKQSFQATGTVTCPDNAENACDQVHDLGFWNSRLYIWGAQDVLRAYNFNTSTSQFSTTPSSKGSIATPYSPAALAISANGTTAGTGIVWAITPANGSTPAMVHAFDASNVATELWNSNINSGRDGLPSYPRYTEPTVANGRVYVATHSNQIAVYGLLQDFSLSSSTSSATVTQGGSTQFTITVSGVSGFTDPVAFSISGLPSGATASFNPTSINGSGQTTVTVSAAGAPVTGTYNLIVSGTSDGLTSTASLSLVVNASSTDAAPPTWSCCTYTYNSDGSYTMTYSASDSQSGLKSIQATDVVDTTVSIPTFPVGTNSTVNFSATESGWSSYVQFQLTDVAGNVATIDPCLINLDRQPGPPVPKPAAIKLVPPELGIVTIENGVNGAPGLTNLRIDIAVGDDIRHIEVAGLKDGETRVVDITSSLPPDGAGITLIPLGKPGGTALVIFGDTPMNGTPQ